MAIFGTLVLEDMIQTGDKTRLDGSKSYVSKDNAAITLVEIEPEGGAGFVAVTGSSSKDWYLDWQYTGVSRLVTVSLRITAGATTTVTKTINVVTSADDKLFSSDSDLIAYEPDIMGWVKAGRSSFLNVHRESQRRILQYLDEAGIEDAVGNRLTKNDVVDVEEVKAWSRDMTLALIFKGLSNQIDDIFGEKFKHYESQAQNRADRAKVRLDLDNDGIINTGEFVQMRSKDLVRE